MGVSIDMNIGMFWETSVGFLKSVVLEHLPKYSQRYAFSKVISKVS